MSFTCPNCEEATVQDGGEFCGSCGESITYCPSCGEPLPGDANFCLECGTEITDPGVVPNEGSADEADGEGWHLADHEFARRVDDSALSSDGLLGKLNRTKSVQIQAGNRALVLENGELVDEIGPGKHKLDSLGRKLRNLDFSSTDVDVVLVDDRDTIVEQSFENLRTAGGSLVEVTIELAVGIDDPGVFYTSMMGGDAALTTADFGDRLDGLIRTVLESEIKRHERDDLYGNLDLKRDVAQAVEHECRSVLERNGLRLVDLRSFDYDDDREPIREKRQELDVREEKEELKDEEARLDRRDRERETEDTVHQERQRVRRESAELAADHQVEKQEVEQDHEIEDMERRHEHTAEREDVEHEQTKKTRRKEGEVERRDLEHEQDTKEIEDMMDLKKQKDMNSLDVEEREQDLEMEREEHDVEVEKERLEARDDVDAETLASLEDTGEEMADLAKMDKAEDLSAEQLDSLGAQESDELAKARQEANAAEKERERVEDQKEFREEMKDVMEGSMDRMQETTESAMDNMGDTAEAAAEDTSDNVIMGGGDGSGGDTTIVQGGGGSDGSAGDPGSGHAGQSDGGTDDGPATVVCPNCGSEEPAGNAFCMDCGDSLEET